MLEMQEQAMERYRAFLPDVEKITRSIRDIGMMARQPYLDAMASTVAQADQHAQFMEQLGGASAAKLHALAFPELQQRFAGLDIGRLDYLARDAQVFQQQSGDATARLLEQLRFVVPPPVREALDQLTETIATRPFLAAVTASGAPVDSQVIAKVNEHITELLATSEGFAGFIHRLAALLPHVSSGIAAALLWVLMTVLLRRGTDPAPRTEQRAVVRRTQDLLAEKLSSRERAHVRIAARTLDVRISPRTTDSRLVGHLSYGTPVVWLRRAGHWTLVEYASGDEPVQGWVYTRYLQRATGRSMSRRKPFAVPTGSL